MKSTLKVVMAAALILFGIFVAARAETVISGRFSPKNIDSTSGVQYSDDPLFQTEITHSFESGLYLDLLHYASVKRPINQSEVNNETDFTVGYYHEFESFNIDVWTSYMNLGPFSDLGTGDVFGFGAEVSREVPGMESLGVSPINILGGVESYSTWAHTDFEGGNLYYVGAGTSLDYTGQLSMLVGYKIVYDDGTYGYDSGWHANIEVGLEYEVSEGAKVALMNNFYIPFNGLDDRKNGPWNPAITAEYMF